MANDNSPCEFIRVTQLPRRFPVLGRSTWVELVTKGEIPSRKVGTARIVRVEDVVRFLSTGNAAPGEGA